ncbi:glycosyl transferase [Paenibacillus sp. GYB003]|uniref:glycosyl transferase n=1 Tax=Paenibacillus sp. GYB003 TaxID=2994392 RepID=UPI002F962459
MSPSPVNFGHLIKLTDETGIVEHALGSIPRRKEGYSTDDQARALWACLEWVELGGEEDAAALEPLIDTYLAFLLWAQQENGRFHNNYAFERTKEDETASDDCLGRCLWACALAMTKLKERERRMAAEAMFVKALPQAERMRSPRGWAYALSAFGLLVRHAFPEPLVPRIEKLASRLTDGYERHAKPGWHWFEPILVYSNGILPWGLLCAYEVLKRDDLLAMAIDSLDFLIRLSVNDRGHIRPVGNKGWCTPEYRAIWDQQPVDVMKLALAASKAYEITGAPSYADIVAKCRSWFHGDNDAGAAMVDPGNGGCFDGLTENGPNLNQGAESVLSYLLTEAVYAKLNADTRRGEGT